MELRREAKTTFRKMPRNSLRSLSLNRRPEALARTAAATVFRSPSIYDEPRPFHVEEVQLSFSLKFVFISLKVVDNEKVGALGRWQNDRTLTPTAVIDVLLSFNLAAIVN